MKVLLFANTDWYLYNFRLALAQEIARQGFDVVLISPRGEYGPLLEKKGFRWLPLAMNRRGLNPWNELRVIMSVTELYRRERPDVVHHFTIKPVVYGSVAARLTGVPAVVNAVTGLGYVFTSDALLAKSLRPITGALLRHALDGRATRLIVQNPDDHEMFLRSRLVDAGKVRLIRSSGVNTERFNLSDPDPNRVPTVLLATRLLWVKGIKEYVEAAQILRNAKVNVRLLLAGVPDRGNPSSVPELQISYWSEAGMIEVLGHVAEIPTLLRDVDIVTLPSYGEGVPKILLEAASAGLPVIATAVPGCREVVEHGVTGLLIRPRSSHDLADAIRYLVERPEERRLMGLRGRQKVLREFDETIIIEQTLDVYRELLGGLPPI